MLPSVVDLFSKGCPGDSGMDGLTRADVAYLTALYRMDLQAGVLHVTQVELLAAATQPATVGAVAVPTTRGMRSIFAFEDDDAPAHTSSQSESPPQSCDCVNAC